VDQKIRNISVPLDRSAGSEAVLRTVRELARVTGADVPMPYARNLEPLAVSHEAEVVAAVQRALYGKPELAKT